MSEPTAPDDEDAAVVPSYRRSSADLLLSTTATLDGYRVVEYLGVVHGTAETWRRGRRLEHTSWGGTLLREPEEYAGAKPTGVKMPSEAWRWEHLRAEARSLGANAIIGLQVRKYRIYGTAVRVERAGGSVPPT